MAGSSINAFVKSIRGYVTANVKNANVDANPYLTKTEAKALPKDLRDNYETHRLLGNGNATVVANKTIEQSCGWSRSRGARARVPRTVAAAGPATLVNRRRQASHTPARSATVAALKRTTAAPPRC